MLKHARAYGVDRICHVCGKAYTAKSAKGMYCSGACRMAAHRQRNRVEDHKGYCKWCGRPFWSKQGRAMYDSAACKQAAYRARNKSGKQLMF